VIAVSGTCKIGPARSSALLYSLLRLTLFVLYPFLTEKQRFYDDLSPKRAFFKSLHLGTALDAKSVFFDLDSSALGLLPERERLTFTAQTVRFKISCDLNSGKQNAESKSYLIYDHPPKPKASSLL